MVSIFFYLLRLVLAFALNKGNCIPLCNNRFAQYLGKISLFYLHCLPFLPVYMVSFWFNKIAGREIPGTFSNHWFLDGARILRGFPDHSYRNFIHYVLQNRKALPEIH